MDLTVSYRFNRHADVLAGYSHFFTGELLDDTGADDDVDFRYLKWRLLFWPRWGAGQRKADART